MNHSISWLFNRHPLLYKTRQKLVSTKVSESQIEHRCYNQWNRKEDLSGLYYAVNKQIFNKKDTSLSDLEKALKIAIWLRNHIKGGPGLGLDSVNALHLMLNGVGGVCSDMAQVFNNFCLLNEIQVREWGLVNTQDSNSGHTFNEVFCPIHNHWVLVDVSSSVFFTGTDSCLPLSVLELFRAAKSGRGVSVRGFNASYPVKIERLKKSLLHPDSIPFLITDYNNRVYDAFLKKFNFLPVSIVHGLVYLTGKSYHFRFPEIGQN